ncbi:universal stress protein [Edaphobacter paludis]|uniref:Universal stress protein n=1 Tax=Edaphobacter paludis TaxID=3035702 RepID=A0AAU7D1M2_9BACT
MATSEIIFSRILVATDFSGPATLALKMAILISETFGAKLSIVHAATPVGYGIDTGAVPIEVLNANLDADKEQINQLVLSEPGLGQLKPSITVAYAETVDLINQVSRKDNIDLIVVGSHGASGLERLALGSVAEAVLHQARCPVLIVGPQCRPERYPFRSILFATDLRTTGLRAAQYATGLAERFHSKLTLLHVMKQRPTPSREDEPIADLKRLIPPDADCYCKADVRVEYGKVAEVIAAVSESECASLIVIGLRAHVLGDHAPWSTVAQVTREVKVAVLGVRGHYA